MSSRKFQTGLNERELGIGSEEKAGWMCFSVLKLNKNSSR